MVNTLAVSLAKKNKHANKNCFRHCTLAVVVVSCSVLIVSLNFRSSLPFPQMSMAGYSAKAENSKRQFKRLEKTSETAVMMFDTRSLDVNLTSDYIYHRWTADLNNRYAQKHGYDFIYLRPAPAGVVRDDEDQESDGRDPAEPVTLKEDGTDSIHKIRPSCYLTLPNQTIRDRGAPWCKLLGVASILERGYSTIIYLDSDAAFLNDTLDIESIFPEIIHQQQVSARTDGSLRQLVWFPTNNPWGNHLPNSGMQIWRSPSENSWRLLRQWWQSDISSTKHAYEQDGLWNFALVEGKINASCGVGLLPYQWMHPRSYGALPLVHIASAFKDYRNRIFQPKWIESIGLNTSKTSTFIAADKVFDMVEAMPPWEIERLQRLLEERNVGIC